MLNIVLRSVPKAASFLAFTACLCATAWAAPSVHQVPNPPTLKPLTMRVGGRMEVTPTKTPNSFGSKNYTYQWPGIYFRAAFKGSQVYFRVGKAHEILHIRIDGQQVAKLVKPTPGIYEVDGLDNNKHHIGVYVATESQDAPDAFGGFAIPVGEKVLRLPGRKRQIEFIGDSYTVGFGNLSPTRICTNEQVWARTDDPAAFGPLTAEHYNADYQINAISGRGVVRNYNGGKADTVPEAYPYVLFNKDQEYIDPTWQPQVIVVGLGTNDYTTKLHAGEKWKTRAELHADYVNTYEQFLNKLRKQNPHAYIIVWAADVANGEVEAQASKVVQQLHQQGFQDLKYLAIHNITFTACDQHPSLKDDKYIAQTLEQVIDAKKGVWKH